MGTNIDERDYVRRIKVNGYIKKGKRGRSYWVSPHYRILQRASTLTDTRIQLRKLYGDRDN